MTESNVARKMNCPGCNQAVDPLRAPAVSVIDGKIVHFCSPNCRETFLNRSPKTGPNATLSEESKIFNGPNDLSRRKTIDENPDKSSEEPDLPAQTELFRSRLVWPVLLQLAVLVVFTFLALLVPPLFKNLLPAVVSATAIVGLATWNIIRDRKLGARKIVEAVSMQFAALAFLAAVFFGAPSRQTSIIALLFPVIETLSRLLEAAGRQRARILSALDAGASSPIPSSWKDNSNLAAGIRILAATISWLRYPLSFVVGLLVFLATARDMSSALTAFATALAALSPRVIRMATGDAHLRAALIAASRRVTIRDADVVQRTAQSKTVLFASRSTLFQPDLDILDWTFSNETGEKAALDALYSIEATVEGRIADAIRRYAIENKARAASNVELTRLEGQGIVADTPWGTVMCGCRSLFLERGISTGPLESHAAAIESSGRRALFLAMDERVAAVFAVEERVMPGTEDVVRKLRRLGFETAMITTAETASAQGIADRLGIDTVYFETPETKLGEILRTISDSGGSAVLVGRGPAFEEHFRAADAAISLSRPGEATQAGFDASGCTIEVVPILVETAKRAHRSAVFNLVLGAGYYLCGVGFAFAAAAQGTFLSVVTAGAVTSALCTFNAPFPFFNRLAAVPVQWTRRLIRRISPKES